MFPSLGPSRAIGHSVGVRRRELTGHFWIGNEIAHTAFIARGHRLLVTDYREAMTLVRAGDMYALYQMVRAGVDRHLARGTVESNATLKSSDDFIAVSAAGLLNSHGPQMPAIPDSDRAVRDVRIVRTVRLH